MSTIPKGSVWTQGVSLEISIKRCVFTAVLDLIASFLITYSQTSPSAELEEASK